MIWMWLAPVFLMVGGHLVFRKGLNQGLSFFQTQFLHLPASTSIVRMLSATKLCGLSMGSFLQNQYSAVALLSSRSFSRRYAILLLCLSGVGLWTTLLGLLAVWKFNGSLLLGAAFFFYLLHRWTGRFESLFQILAGAGVFLMGAQWALEKQSILMSFLGQSELHFLLADGRLPVQFLWMSVAFLGTLLVGVESGVVFLALVLLAAGSLSLNGAVAMAMGELLAHIAMLWWKSRKLNQDTKHITKFYALASLGGLVLGFVVTGFIRDLFAWSITFEGNVLTARSLQFFTSYFILIALQCLVVMTWGHFAAKKTLEEVQTGDYFSAEWISQGLIGKNIARFILKKLGERLDLLILQKNNLSASERNQIPSYFLKEHEEEVLKLTLWMSRGASPSP